jgi:hypothetical protein
VIDRLDGVRYSPWPRSAPRWHARPGVPPTWLGYIDVLLAAALVVSGVGYLLPSSSPAPAAFVPGRLLLVWMTTGVWLAVAGSR